MWWYLYLIAGALFAIALLIGRSGRKYSIHAENLSGNIAMGDNSANLSQINAPRQDPERQDPKQKPDRVAWTIGIVAALIAAAQLAHDVLAK